MTTKLISKKEIAEGTMAFTFERPEEFEYKAGQFLEITLIDPPETDAEGNTRAFSIANAPYEEGLTVATRMRDTAFKRVLKNFSRGSEVQLDGPFGSFTLHNASRKPAVFLIGGIGITPIRSIILQASHQQLPHSLYLFYSNRRPEDAAFLKDLQEVKNPEYHFIPTMSDMERSQVKWDGEVGYIDSAMITRHLADLETPIYYLAGPAAMVKAMRQLLSDMGIDDDNIRTEEFSGY